MSWVEHRGRLWATDAGGGVDGRCVRHFRGRVNRVQDFAQAETERALELERFVFVSFLLPAFLL